MQIQFNSLVIINGAIIALGIFAGIGLLLRKENRIANQLLALLLICSSLWLIDNFFRISGIYSTNPDFYFKPIYYSLAFGPLIYLYVLSITNSSFRFKRTYWLHFIPVALQASLYIFLSLKDYTFKRWYWMEVHSPITYRIEFNGTFLSMCIYLTLSIVVLRKYQKWLSQNFSNTSKKELNWLKTLLILMIILTVQWFIEVILRDFYGNFQFNHSILILGLTTVLLAFKAFNQADQKGVEFQNSLSKDPKKENIDIKPEILRRIVDEMETKKAYLDPNLNLKGFSERCGIPQRTVSQYLNQELKLSFHSFVNAQRVAEFKRQVSIPENKNLTLEGLAYESGFNSKSSFNRIFKKYEGKTPSDYLKSIS